MTARLEMRMAALNPDDFDSRKRAKARGRGRDSNAAAITAANVEMTDAEKQGGEVADESDEPFEFPVQISSANLPTKILLDQIVTTAPATGSAEFVYRSETMILEDLARRRGYTFCSEV
jgi:hypothetical protein